MGKWWEASLFSSSWPRKDLGLKTKSINARCKVKRENRKQRLVERSSGPRPTLQILWRTWGLFSGANEAPNWVKPSIVREEWRAKYMTNFGGIKWYYPQWTSPTSESWQLGLKPLTLSLKYTMLLWRNQMTSLERTLVTSMKIFPPTVTQQWAPVSLCHHMPFPKSIRFLVPHPWWSRALNKVSKVKKGAKKKKKLEKTNNRD